MTRFLGCTRCRELWNTTLRRNHLRRETSQHENLRPEINLTMTRSDVHSWPTGTKSAIRRNFCELCVFKETLLVCHCADVNLLRNAFVRLAYSRGFRFSPADNRSHRMNEDGIKGWKANRHHWTSYRDWVFHCGQGNVRVKVFAIKPRVRRVLGFDHFDGIFNFTSNPGGPLFR